jgi:capsular polysaccharide export protein
MINTMKNVLFIHAHEKDKVIFFSSISKFLNKKGLNTMHLAFRRLEKEVYKKCGIYNVEFIPKVLKNYSNELSISDQRKYNIEEILSFNIQFNDLNNYKYDREELYNNIKRYINYLNDLHHTYKIDLIITWNDTFMFDRAAKQFAKCNNISLAMFEAGIFRPYTITIDSQGINYGNSVPQDPEFYKQIEFDEKKLEYLFSDIIQTSQEHFFSIKIPKLKKFYLKERIIDKLHTDFLRDEINLEIIFENLYQKVKKNITKKINFRTLNDNFSSKKLPKKFIFVPFQVHDDSQIILNSPTIKSMGQLVEIINREVLKFNQNYKEKYYVIFKEHPADFGRIDYSELYQKYKEQDHLIFLKNGNTNELIKKCDLVITVNSTVGIEALKSYKPVITLGNAYYNIDGIVHPCLKLDQLNQVIKSALDKGVNKKLISKFLYYLRFNYQIEGNWRQGKFNYKQLEKKLNLTSRK